MTCPYDGREMRVIVNNDVEKTLTYQCQLCGYTYIEKKKK